MEEDRQRRMQEAEERRRAMDERMAQMNREREERMRSMHSPPFHSPAPPQMPSYPNNGFASSGSPSAPSSYQPSSAPQQFESYECRSCKRQMRTIPSNHKCPGCGVTFDRVENPDGTYTETGAKGSYRFSFRGAKSMLALIGLVVAGLAALVRKVLD
jgi:hypothetical protein